MNLAQKLAYARQFAKRAHGDQRYDSKRMYICHLDEVRNTALEFEVTDEDILVATLLHDTIEDTNTSLECIEDKFGARVMHLVHAVTNEDGKNRKERNTYTYPKIRAVQGATMLKLCDRIANVRNCWQTVQHIDLDKNNHSLLGMYKLEYGAFRKALKTEQATSQELLMWDELDCLLAWIPE